MRGHDESQRHVIDLGIFEVLLELSKQDDLDQKVLVKVLALIHDSFMEWDGCRADWSVNQTDVEMCNNLTNRAIRLIENVKDSSNHNQKIVAEKLRMAMVAANCNTEIFDKYRI